jgi:hypothetical protein
MIMDKLLEFADSEDISGFTAAGGDELIGDVVDLQVARDIGQGNPLYLVIQVDTAIVGTTSTVQFKLASDAGFAIATDGTASVHWASDVIAEADLVAGYTLIVPLPYGGSKAYERYLGVQADVGVNNLSAGAVSAFIVNDPSAWKAYAEGAN